MKSCPCRLPFKTVRSAGQKRGSSNSCEERGEKELAVQRVKKKKVRHRVWEERIDFMVSGKKKKMKVFSIRCAKRGCRA